MDNDFFELALKLLHKAIKFFSSEEVKSFLNVTTLFRNAHYFFKSKDKDK